MLCQAETTVRDGGQGRLALRMPSFFLQIDPHSLCMNLRLFSDLSSVAVQKSIFLHSKLEQYDDSVPQDVQTVYLLYTSFHCIDSLNEFA